MSSPDYKTATNHPQNVVNASAVIYANFFSLRVFFILIMSHFSEICAVFFHLAVVLENLRAKKPIKSTGAAYGQEEEVGRLGGETPLGFRASC